MALCRQIVDLIRADQRYHADDAAGIRHITQMQGNLVGRDQMIDPFRIGSGGAAQKAMNLISFF